jgi:hypothetical protein
MCKFFVLSLSLLLKSATHIPFQNSYVVNCVHQGWTMFYWSALVITAGEFSDVLPYTVISKAGVRFRACLLKARVVEPEDTPITREQHGNNTWLGVFYAVRAEAT